MSQVSQIVCSFISHPEQRVPRAEVAAIGQLIADATHAIDKKFKVVIVGSFRRGSADSGDIDILTTHSREDAIDGFLPKLLAVLHRIGLLIADLTDSEGKFDSV